MANQKDLHGVIEQSIFYGKNKEYGAYVHRQKINSNMLKGLFIGMGLSALLYLLPILTKNNDKDVSNDIIQVQAEITPYSDLMAPPPLPIDEKPAEAVLEAPKVATQKYVKPALKPDSEVLEEELIPTTSELKTANPGRKTQEGTGDIHADYKPVVVADAQPKPQPTPTPTPAKPPPPKKEEIFTYVQRFPQFPGGEDEMQRFIGENIEYPVLALETGIEGVVIVQFVVDTKGKINDPVVVRDIGGGCGQAAIDVVNKMPTWEPGEQNGRPVSVRYTMPVRFKLIL
ncbi:MAG: energy transducer TonB [Saprospiraceae bacterium]|nr:energy transducer TonB [Saprospiraceae bacterium]